MRSSRNDHAVTWFVYSWMPSSISKGCFSVQLFIFRVFLVMVDSISTEHIVYRHTPREIICFWSSNGKYWNIENKTMTKNKIWNFVFNIPEHFSSLMTSLELISTMCETSIQSTFVFRPIVLTPVLHIQISTVELHLSPCSYHYLNHYHHSTSLTFSFSSIHPSLPQSTHFRSLHIQNAFSRLISTPRQHLRNSTNHPS